MKAKILPLHRRLLAAAMIFLSGFKACANPTGWTVVSGNANVKQNGSQMTITAGNGAVINWQTFNIAAGEKTTFKQPSATSIVWNNINDQNPSQVFGTLQANGVVVLLNSSGFYFGPNSFVSAAGLVVTTANFAPPQNAGGAWEFNGPPPLASIVNYGQIKIGNNGSCFLIADEIENYGDIEAPGGSVGLAAGKTVTLSERPDGRGMSMQVTLPQGSVDNEGKLIADGGTISLNAKVVNQNGFIQADSVQNQNGVIELVASDSLNLGSSSEISARGDDSANGSTGGNVTLRSENIFSDEAGSQINTAGGAQGGNGGNIEISAPNIQSLNSTMDASAQSGFTGGEFLLDPVDIVLGNSGSGAPDGSGTVAYNSGNGTLNINVNTAFLNKKFSQILLQASGNITVGQNVTWDLSASTGTGSGQVTLEAGANIIFQNGSKITDANSWSVNLQAGYDFQNNTVDAGEGSIYLNANSGGETGGGSIQTAQGNISLLAGQDILIGSGYVRSRAGGNVSAQAVAGDIDTGSYAHGYTFSKSSSLTSTYYQVDPIYGSGGISTEAGGNVSIIAGGDVTSFLPSGNSATTIGGDAGSGAFGPQAGNVTVVAGGNVVGHYVVADGTGKIVAGAELDANGNPVIDSSGNYILNPTSGGSAGTSDTKLALSLIAGGWTVDAAQDINLQEVRNPNGVFNNLTAGQTPATYHYFNYAPDAYVDLSAGHAVNLGDSSSSLPRADSDGVDVPFIYAPILNIVAGAGGVSFSGDGDPYNKLILFPSAQGSLTITTTGGGSLNGNLTPNSDGSPGIFDLIVSDSSQTQYSDPTLDIFGLNDHASTPIHLNNPTPIVLNISGDLNDFLLSAPEAAQINVVGDMNNSRFQGMNLNSSDVTSINVGQTAKQNLEASGVLNPATDGNLHVGGDINNRGEFTTVTADAPPNNIGYLSQVYPPDAVAINLAKELFYDPATKQLTIQGAVTDQILALLQNLQIQVYQNGQPQFDSLGNPILQTVSIIDAATANALKNEYVALGPVPTSRDSGYILGGGGKFVINAANIDLGTTLGIQSQGVSYDAIETSDANGNPATLYPLANIFTKGADISVNTTGDLDLFSTTISSLNDGSINVNAGGGITVGSSTFTGNNATPRGIFSTGLGDVTVIADGDINVNGSRIAAYDGGNVTVESLGGNINAGNGAIGFVGVSSFSVNPVTYQVTSTAATIPGSGILATTFPTSQGRLVGNILVETPNGNINANAGGIVELPLNGNNDSRPQVVGLAGYELRDSSGNLVTAADILDGTPVLVSNDRNIDATGSGVIGQNVTLKASGGIKGVIFSQYNVSLDAIQPISVTAIGRTIEANGPVQQSTLIGTESVQATGADASTSILSQDANGQGSSFAQGTAANSTSQAASATSVSDTAQKSSDNDDEDSKKSGKGKGISLAQKVSRVTVLLPKKD